jgi:aminopeptidase N
MHRISARPRDRPQLVGRSILVAMAVVALASDAQPSGQGTANARGPSFTSSTDPSPGIAESLASARAALLADVRSELSFDIPLDGMAPVAGHEILRFALRDPTSPLVLDFDPGHEPGAPIGPVAVRANGRDTTVRRANGHLVVMPADLRQGINEIEMTFAAGTASLNRNPDFLYTLFVPARAHLAFPCFDQPNLKARFRLTLSVPAGWQVVANGVEIGREVHGGRVTVRFADTKPLPTYLFAFVAGHFSVETAERNGRTLRMFHRETDATKVARNRDAIFDLHAQALAWLEDYTGIPYPWGKFDFVLIPSLQFGGMEHAGAILYNASSLMLEESATVNQQLNRASAISHETTHMWFGDLVTMKWFDDVWTKEVFANFMADKIVSPSFPQFNHELRFLLEHYPAAYEVDRTAGANAIKQELGNLDEAGTLYGAIIYDKAPIVMRNLETLVGPGKFHEGVREYLRRYSFANATWPDLIELLGMKTDQDLVAWSHAWVDQPGRPTIRTELNVSRGRLMSLAFTQTDPRQRGLVWNQRMTVTLGYEDGTRTLSVDFPGRRAVVAEAPVLKATRYVLPNGGGVAYGEIELDAASRTYFVKHISEIADPLTRGSVWVTLWDEMLRGAVPPATLVGLMLGALPVESDELNTQQVLRYTHDA